MRISIFLILLICPLMVEAQVKQQKQTAAGALTVYDYFRSNNLNPDSAATPYLFYNVYDWAGTRYKYSGRSKKGIDCSGFVSRVYSDTYCVPLCGGSRDIWTTVVPVEREDLKEGDLLFFKIKKGQISHIAIYLGKNKFAHASVKSGVIISDLDEEYYRKRFYKGGRVEGLGQ